MTALDTGTEDLRAEIDDGVAVITMNRPERRNALSEAMLSALGGVLAQVETDEAVGCVVLTGAGGAFCAGGDVKGMAARPADRSGNGAGRSLNAIFPPADFEREVMARARQLAAGPSIAYRYMKENLNRAVTGELGDCMDIEVTHHLHTALTKDHREATHAFVDKRDPHFRGR